MLLRDIVQVLHSVRRRDACFWSACSLFSLCNCAPRICFLDTIAAKLFVNKASFSPLETIVCRWVSWIAGIMCIFAVASAFLISLHERVMISLFRQSTQASFVLSQWFLSVTCFVAMVSRTQNSSRALDKNNQRFLHLELLSPFLQHLSCQLRQVAYTRPVACLCFCVAEKRLGRWETHLLWSCKRVSVYLNASINFGTNFKRLSRT